MDCLSLTLPRMSESGFVPEPVPDSCSVRKFPKTGESPLPVSQLLNLYPSPPPKMPDLDEREGVGGDQDSG